MTQIKQWVVVNDINLELWADLITYFAVCATVGLLRGLTLFAWQ